MQSTPLSLLELNNCIKELINTQLEKAYWVTGEISEIKVNTSGHCYLELIQKDESSDQIIARSRATIWAAAFRMIKPYFETTTKHLLSTGLSIMVKVSVQFHEVYGISLNISDIEPSFTVGELALQKQKIIQRLTEEGVLNMNKDLEMPFLCQKIAIISSSTAAGYQDFADQLQNNTAGYKYYLKLFHAIMQGEEAENSIISALDKIYSLESFFDVVVIIRGGGSKADLSCFDSYWLAYHITQFPLPVFTGIGHEQDDSITDIVAHSRFKTPTAVAAFLIDNFAERDDELEQFSETVIFRSREFLSHTLERLIQNSNGITGKVKELVLKMNTILQSFNYTFVASVKRLIHLKEKQMNKKEISLVVSSKKYIENNNYILNNISKDIIKHLKFSFKNKFNTLERIDDKIIYLNPVKVLKRGYSITLKNGRTIKDTKSLEKEDQLETILFKGKIISVVKNKKS